MPQIPDTLTLFQRFHDGDFVYSPEPPSVIAFGRPLHQSKTIIHTTKPMFVGAKLKQFTESYNVTLCGWEGLRTELPKHYLRAEKIFFWGDLDPPDLLIFLWMHSRLPSLRYFGMCDKILELLPPNHKPYLTIDFSQSEIDVFTLKKNNLLSLEGIIGVNCWRLLLQHKKVEAEIINFIESSVLASHLASELGVHGTVEPSAEKTSGQSDAP